MKKNNILIVTLVTTLFLVTSMFSVSSITEQTNEKSLEVIKEVYDDGEWVDEIYAEKGDTLTFRIIVTYYNITEPAHEHYAEDIIIEDELPDCLEYELNTADPFEPDITGNILTWDLGSTKLYHEESYIITFNATVAEYTTSSGCINEAFGEAYEHCTGETIKDKDTVTIYAVAPEPEIDVEKYVWDGKCFWVKETNEYPGETVSFKIIVNNTGDADLTDVIIEDTLSDSLEYLVGSSTVNGNPQEPESINGNVLTWNCNILYSGETIEIIFDATVIGQPCDIDTNHVYVEGKSECATVTDEDTVEVHVNGMCMEKEVWDDDAGSWMESTGAVVGDTVRFRITIYYVGPKTLYNIHVEDELPECFNYSNNAIPEEPVVSGNLLTWDFPSEYDLEGGETLIIEFDALVEGGICEGECINYAYVIADECSGRVFEGEDTATVSVMDVDAGGPYYGLVDEDITLTGQVYGGTAPYLYEWDLDNDGNYNEATGKFTTVSFDSVGNYQIGLKVTDNEGLKGFDETVVIVEIGENSPPNKPNVEGQEYGLIPGALYSYEFQSTDPDGDDVWYYIDWGDGDAEEWIGPYDSGENVTVSHSFDYRMTSYNIRAKAKDSYGQESSWGTLRVTTPKAKEPQFPLIYNFIQRLVERFPTLGQFLNI